MQNEELFRTSFFGGYNKEDVLKYIQAVENNIQSIKNSYQKEIEELKKENERLKSLLQEEGKEMLEHAFDFLEAAFGDSQEMVIFLTGLNSAEDAVAFLQTCDCERYRRYNQSLLFRESDRRLRGEIDRLLAET